MKREMHLMLNWIIGSDIEKSDIALNATHELLF